MYWLLVLTMQVLYRYANESMVLELCRWGKVKADYPHTESAREIQFALDRWHQWWAQLREKAISNNSWEALGFFKNGDQYEAALRLLLSSKAAPHISKLLDWNVNRLELLQKLNRATS